MMTNDFLRAFALMIVFEGLLPFMAPGLFRETMQRLSGLDDRRLRVIGLGGMIVGLLILQAVHWLL
jgi:uncharacterized protein YjeT (DUF2065 family)